MKQFSGFDNVDADAKRRRERNRKKNPEESLNKGKKIIKYVQTSRQRTAYRTIYLVFSILSFLLSVFVYFVSDMTNTLTGMIAIWAAMVVGLAHVYRTTSQLVIDDAMTADMYQVAVKNFQIVNIVYAVIISAVAVITIVLTGQQAPSGEAVSGSAKFLSTIAVILASVLAWAMPIIEKTRKLEPCFED